ncbi:MAG: CpsD/CapB family tyrosine-protein kinase [Pararhizobium sp.]
MTTHISPEEARLQPADALPPTADEARYQTRNDLLAHRAHLSGERQALWASLPELDIDPKIARKSRLVTIDRSHTAHASFDILRTNLLQTVRRNGWTTVGVTSPTAGCGKTLVSLNLAFSLQHQEDCRVVLVDLDLRRPQVARGLGLADVEPIADFLRGNSDIKRAFRRHRTNLAIGPNATPVQYSAELLQSPEAAKALMRMHQRLAPDICIYDLPPMLASDDVLAFLPNLDGVLMVAAAEKSTIDEVDVCEQRLAEKTNVLGVVLNKCRFLPETYGY